jgi:hypothetical protein
MLINKIDESSSADLFFEVMSRFNDRDNLETIEKTASVGGRVVSEAGGQLGQLSRITSATGEARVAIKGAAEALGSGGKISKEIADALVNSTKQVSGKVNLNRLGGIGRLVAGNSKTARFGAFMTIRKDLSSAVNHMLREDGVHVAKYIDEAGNFKQLGIDELYAAARKSNGAVSPKAADELVDGFLSGRVYDDAYRGGPVQQRLRDEAQAAADAVAGGKGAAKGADEAAGAAKGADEAAGAAKVSDDVIKNPGPTPLDDIARAKENGSIEYVEQIQKMTGGAKSGRVAGDAAAKFKNAHNTLDEAAKIAAKITPDSVRLKIQYYIQDLKDGIVRSEDATNKITQTMKDINLSGAHINGNVTFVQQAAIGDMNKLLNAMDADLGKFSRRLGQVKGNRKALNEAAEEIATGGRAAGGTADATATGGRAGGGQGGGGGGGGRGGDNYINIGGGRGAGLGDDLTDAAGPAHKAYFDAQQAAMQKQINYLVKNGDDIALELKNLRALREAGGPGAATAGKMHDDFVKVIQRMENIGNVNISGKLLKELSEAGIKVGAKQTSWWGKAAKVFGWLGLITAGAAGGHYLYNKHKDSDGGGGGGLYGPDGDHDGDGIPNKLDPDWPGNKKQETQRPDPYIGVSDPAAIESLAQADPRSPKYDAQNGWQAANNTIMNLEAAGKTSELNAFLNALQLAYRKRFRMKLNPPFVVTGSPVPLYYAFLNQHRSPAPNLAESTGRTLAIKTMVLNDGLNDPEQKGPVEIFDVNYRLMNKDAQRAINFTAEETIAKGLAERGNHSWDPLGWFSDDRHKSRRRSRSHSMGEELSSDVGQGISGQRSRRMSDSDKLMIQRIMDRRGGDRFSGLKKFAELSSRDNAERLISLEGLADIASNSTNIIESTDNQMLDKKADDSSKSYYKDAVTGLNNTDKTLQSYFAGLGGLYDQRLETRKADFKTLYNVTDETGEDLIYEAHPKEVVVSDSIGRGGLVENGLEQKRQTHGVALSAPTGNYRANYASRYDALKKLAN